MSHIRERYVDFGFADWSNAWTPRQPKDAVITLRSAGGLRLAQWRRSVTYVPAGRDYNLFINGDTMLWFNDRTRRVKVQLSIRIGDKIVLRMKPVKIRAGEVFVLKPPLPIRYDRKVTRHS